MPMDEITTGGIHQTKCAIFEHPCLPVTQMGSEPLRPTGKLLTADKVVVVAQAGGMTKFSAPKWAQEFARATSAALGKPVVHVDVAALGISY